MQIEVLAVDRRLIDLEIAGVDDGADRVVMASATQSGMLCVTRMNSIENGPTVTRCRGLIVWSRLPAIDAVLFELGLDERQRHGGAIDRTVEQLDHMGNRADVILVPVREDRALTLRRRASTKVKSGMIRSTPS